MEPHPRRLISSCSASQRAPSLRKGPMQQTHSPAVLNPPPSVTSPPIASPPPASPPTDPTPKSARRKHSQVLNRPGIEGHASIEEPLSIRPRKKVRGVCRGIKSGMIVEANGRIKLNYDESCHGAEKSEIHSLLTHDIGAIVRTHCSMEAPSFSELPDEDKSGLLDFLTVNYEINYDDGPTRAYINEIFAIRFRTWKHELSKYFKGFRLPEAARASPPIEFLKPEERLSSWYWLCDHFMTSKFRTYSAANTKNRGDKKLNHHGGAKRFIYRVKKLREENKSKFPAIDNFKEVYVTPDNPIATPLYEKMQEKVCEFIRDNESQCTPDTPLDQIPLPDVSIGVNILTETLQELGPSVGSYVRGMGRGMVRDVRRRSSYEAPMHSRDEIKELKDELGHSRDEVKELKDRINQLFSLLSAKGIASNDDLEVPRSTSSDHTQSDASPILD